MKTTKTEFDRVPLPERTNAKGKSIYPFPDMAVGDSKLFTGEIAKAALHAAYQYGYRFGKQFAARKEEKGIRIWRVK